MLETILDSPTDTKHYVRDHQMIIYVQIGLNQIDSLSENIILFIFYHDLFLSMGSWQSVWYHANSIFNHTETINAVLSQSLYYISPIVYKGNNIFTNLIHVTTKTTRSSMATVLEQALTTMYAVLSFSVRKRKKE